MTTQKKLSFACDVTIEPAPIDNTINALAISEVNPKDDNSGDKIDAVVMIARYRVLVYGAAA